MVRCYTGLSGVVNTSNGRDAVVMKRVDSEASSDNKEESKMLING